MPDAKTAESGPARLRRALDELWPDSGPPRERRPRVHGLGTYDRTAEIAGNTGPEIFLTPRSVLIGPAWGQGHAPCTHCLVARWQRLRPEAERRLLESGDAFRAPAETPYITDFTAEAVHRLYAVATSPAERTPERGPATATVLELSLSDLKVRRFPLLADSGCPHCARPVPTSPETALPELRERPKPGPDTYRLRGPGEFDVDTSVFANPVCGALGETVHIDLTSPTMAPATGNMRITAAGLLLDVGWSGQTDTYDTSRLFGVFEGLERHAGTQQRRHGSLVTGSRDELLTQGLRVLDPRDCGLYDEAFHDTRGRLTPYTPDLRLRWVWGRSLREGEPVLVPEQLVYYVRDGEPNTFVDECSNGCAVGSTPEEALLHGLLELVERDAFVLGWYAGLALPEIDTASVTDPETRLMIERIRMHGYGVRLFDNRIDLPFPVVNAVGVREDGGPGNLCFAAGSGLTPDSALRSAVSEIATYIPSLALRTEKRREEVEAMADDYGLVRELKDHPLLFALPRMAEKADFLLGERRGRPVPELYRDWERRRPRSGDLLADLRACVAIMAGRGFDVIGVDQTSPEQVVAGLSNVCVIVPGLVPIDFGWAKQRVFSSPRFHGLVERTAGRGAGVPNPVPHPFP